MHLMPVKGSGRDVAGPIIDMLFPAERPKTIPIISLFGSGYQARATAKMLADLLKENGHLVGRATHDGAWMNGFLIRAEDLNSSVKLALMMPVDVAIIETSPLPGMESYSNDLDRNISARLSNNAHLATSGCIDAWRTQAEDLDNCGSMADLEVINADEQLHMRSSKSGLLRDVQPATQASKGACWRGRDSTGSCNRPADQCVVVYEADKILRLSASLFVPLRHSYALRTDHAAMFAVALAKNLGMPFDRIAEALPNIGS